MKMRRYNGTDWDVLHPETTVEQLKGTLPVEKGGTGASTASQARENLGAADADHEHNEYLNKQEGGTIDGAVQFNNSIGFVGTVYHYASIVLNANSYGDALPETGVEGRLFFLRS